MEITVDSDVGYGGGNLLSTGWLELKVVNLLTRSFT